MRYLKMFLILCSLCFIGNSAIRLISPTKVQIWYKHDLGYVPDTVITVGYWLGVNHMWYVRSTDSTGEYWSDRCPIIIDTTK